MGSELAIAHPEDTVESCLEIMTKKNLSAIPVVKHDGRVLGTLSMKDLAKEMLSTPHTAASTAATAVAHMFSAPSHFPENITAAGGGYHDDISAGLSTPKQLQELYDQLKHDLEAKPLTEMAMEPVCSFDSAAAERFNLDPNLHERAAASFSEASTFPEYTPSEDELFTQTHGATTEWRGMTEAEISRAEDTYVLAQSSLLGEMKTFSEPSDFPEVPTVEEVIAAREGDHAAI
jgi:CBS domain-containing protein